MDVGNWISVAAVFGSLGAMVVAIRQAEIAKQSAAESRRSADAAEGQLAIMREQWEVEKARLESANEPSIRLHAKSLSNLSSVLLLINEGAQNLRILGVRWDGSPVPIEDFEGIKGLPTPTYLLLPQQSTPVLRATYLPTEVGGRAPGIHEGPTDPKSFTIDFEYGQGRWGYEAEVGIDTNGQIGLINGVQRLVQ